MKVKEGWVTCYLANLNSALDSRQYVNLIATRKIVKSFFIVVSQNTICDSFTFSEDHWGPIGLAWWVVSTSRLLGPLSNPSGKGFSEVAQYLLEAQYSNP